MGWATHYIEKLRARETVSFGPRGASMKGRIGSGHRIAVKVPGVIFLRNSARAGGAGGGNALFAGQDEAASPVL